MIHLYQIGDVAFHFHQQLFYGEDTTAKGDASELLWSPEYRFPNKQFQIELPHQTMSGYLFGDCAWRADQIYQRLKKLVGRPTDIIGYALTGCCNEFTAGDCACQSSGGCQIVWYHNWGVLKSINVGTESEGEVLTISIEMQYMTFWQPLPRFFFQYKSSGQMQPRVKTPTTPYRNGLNAYPTCDMVFCDNLCTQFQKQLFNVPLLGYDPEFWVADTCHLPFGYPNIGKAQSWGANLTDDYVFIDPSIWSAPPLSIYAFRRLPQSGMVTIHTVHSDGVWGEVEEDTQLDLSLLNSRLIEEGYGGIQHNDTLYMGDVVNKPGFLIRDGVVLTVPRPEATYPGMWPGFLMPGNARVQVGAPMGVQVAFKHTMRRM